jgi:hypothetical protein
MRCACEWMSSVVRHSKADLGRTRRCYQLRHAEPGTHRRFCLDTRRRTRRVMPGLGTCHRTRSHAAIRTASLAQRLRTATARRSSGQLVGGTWLGVYSTTGCTADSNRAESGCGTATDQRVCPPTARRGKPATQRGQHECGDLHQHERTVALGFPMEMLRTQRRETTVREGGWAGG